MLAVIKKSDNRNYINNNENIKGMEKDSIYYDKKFLEYEHWKEHYSKSKYYPLWAIIVERIKRSECNNVLDIGCGPGQFANYLYDQWDGVYTGVDFSYERIKFARTNCPNYLFINGDVFKDVDIYKRDYDAVVCLEFLEHIENDINVLINIQSGTYLLATVPNFPLEQHVRYFENHMDVIERYGKYIQNIQVDTHVGDYARGVLYFIISGIVR